LSLILPGGGSLTEGRPTTGEGARKVRILLTRKGLVPSYAAIFAQYFAFGGVVTLLPVHVERLDMGAFEVGMLLAAFSAMFIITQFPSGAISDRAGRLPPIVGGLLCVIFSLTVLPSLSSFPLLAAVMAIYGAGYGFVFPSISALVTDHTSSEERGLAMGLFHALLTAGVAIGAPLMGWVGGLTGTGAALLITPAPMLLALVIALTFLKRA
jgi:MFS transporter, DHA1 family, multidrug resistance protein